MIPLLNEVLTPCLNVCRPENQRCLSPRKELQQKLQPWRQLQPRLKLHHLQHLWHSHTSLPQMYQQFLCQQKWVTWIWSQQTRKTRTTLSPLPQVILTLRQYTRMI